MAALAADLEAVRVAVQAAVEKERSWDDGDWSVFVVDVVSFLLGKHKKQSFVVAAAVGLIVYGVTTEEDLQGVAGQPPDDEKFKRQLTADKYGVPAAICDMLFAQYVAGKSDRGRSSSGGELDDRPVKRRLVDVQDEFFATVPDAKMTKDTMSFPKTIVDSLDQTAMYVRDCYAPMYATLCRLLEVAPSSSERRRYAGVIVTGTSGIGKTFMSCYTTYRLVKEELCTVVYNFHNSKRYVLAPLRAMLERLPHGDSRRAILEFDAFKDAGLLPGESEEGKDSSHWWGEINMNTVAGRELYTKLKNTRSIWLVVDLHDHPYSDERPECRVALFSSLRLDKFKGFAGGGGGGVPKLYMPVWSLDESVRCVKALPQLSMTKETVEERFEVFGGSARMLFNDGNDIRTIEDQLHLVNADVLASVLDPNGTNPSLTSYLVHAEVDDEFRLAGRRFASVDIMQRLHRKLVHTESFSVRVWLSATQGEYQLTGARAAYAEQLWHRYVNSPTSLSVEVKELGKGLLAATKTCAVERRVLQANFSKTKVFSSMSMSDLNTLAVGDYALPMITNFPAIDSFGVVAGTSPWTSPSSSRPQRSKGGAYTLLMFQMTLASEHTLIGHRVVSVIDKVSVLLKRKPDRVKLVFVVEKCADFLFQQYVSDKKDAGKQLQRGVPEALAEVEQFALQFM